VDDPITHWKSFGLSPELDHCRSQRGRLLNEVGEGNHTSHVSGRGEAASASNSDALATHTPGNTPSRLYLLMAALCLIAKLQAWSAPDVHASHLAGGKPSSFADMVSLPTGAMVRVDIARMNLLCAQGLPGATDLDLKVYLNLIEQWANRVRQETERHQYRFKRNPAEFEHSEGFFRMLMLTVVLTEDFGVHYDPKRASGPAAATVNDGFFADSHSVFLHGCWDRNGGAPVVRCPYSMSQLGAGWGIP
jgi:hypothetical protein